MLAQVDAALARHGLRLGHDPWTVGVGTVGGALATNGLGYLGARAGSFGAQVRALEGVLADGTIVRTRSSPARSTGFDLARLLVGTEGTLGIITEATLAALPVPEERVIHAWRLPSFDAGVAVAAALRRTGVRPACLELSADDAPGPATMLLVFDGLDGEAALLAARAARLVAAAGGSMLGGREAERQWEERHAIAERWAAARRGGGGGEWPPDGAQFDYAHVGVPLGGLAAVRATARALVERHGLTLIEEGLWHWPELYSVVVSGPPGSAEGVRATIDGVCAAAVDAGGTLEYCHGVGWKLAHLAEREHGAAGLAVLRRLKAALVQAARERGITRFRAEVLRTNEAVLALLRELDETARPVVDGPLATYDLTLPEPAAEEPLTGPLYGLLRLAAAGLQVVLKRLGHPAGPRPGG